MSVIENAWKEFEKQVVPANAVPGQREAMRDAFKAGASMMFMHLAAMDGPEEQCVKHMDEIHAEILGIYDEIKARGM